MPDARRAATPFDQLDDVFSPHEAAKAARDPAPARPAAEGRSQAAPKRTRVEPVSLPGRAVPDSARTLPTVSLPERPARVREEEDYITTTFRYPRYVNRMMDEYLLDHPHHSKTSLFLNAMKLMGFAVDEEDLLPRRGQGRR